jgi:hypothetical protein
MSKKIPAVRILPMSPNEKSFRGRSVEDVQLGFFLKELPSPERGGRYRYPTSGLRAEPGTVVLFQYEGAIIASAIFHSNQRFEQPEDGYRGAMLFDVESIKVFQPVGPETMHDIWPEFPGFGQAKHEMNPAYYPAFEKQLVDVETPATGNREVQR